MIFLRITVEANTMQLNRITKIRESIRSKSMHEYTLYIHTYKYIHKLILKRCKKYEFCAPGAMQRYLKTQTIYKLIQDESSEFFYEK